MASSPELPEIGSVVAGRFELRSVLGKGGMGVVYEAHDNERDELCALKILSPHHGDKAKVVARFDLEAQITAKLHGPNVAKVFDVGALPDDSRYIAMELLTGRDLAAELAARGSLPISTAVDIAIQTAEAMTEAHALGVVHRDLKPANLFLVEDDDRLRVKVLDFGISRLVDDETHLTTEFSQLGTVAYMSPEQVESAARVDARTDVWSLGVVLYEMIVGRPPFEGAGTGILVAIMTRPAALPSLLVDDLPLGLEDVILRALEKSPDARFQSMEELATALAPWATKRRRRSRTRIALLAGLPILALAGAAAFLLAPETPSAASVPSASVAASASAAPSARHASSPRRASGAHSAQTPQSGAHISGAPRTTRRP
jgi:serine/threonine protein kinase